METIVWWWSDMPPGGSKDAKLEADATGGFALIAVIWIAGLLAVTANSFGFSVRSHTLANANIMHNVRAEYIADGMADLAALRLANWRDGDPPYPLNGVASACIWSEDVSVWITVQDQGGLADLNTASPMLLTRLIGSLPTTPEVASEIVRRIRDFRDPDGMTDRQLPEEIDYDGLTWRPKNGPFEVSEELDQIPGLSFENYKVLRSMVTTHSRQPGIDFDRAPKKVLSALRIGNDAEHGSLDFSSPSAGRVFGIEIAVKLANGSSYVRQSLVTLLRQPGRPFATLSWQRSSDIPADLAAPSRTCLN